ncbi:polysaccharide lyase family 7 protein [Marinomonas sp. C2222]|uniref:Polysaccharide lyase family 7 protein n=1 Tax=Marinomonas sargassi TaxID=2984494 RepID=A0ABT2YPT5_9GAMM|nr:polysaccharide lyase family 7 protein [Marinomonas sargassi]MCV2401901.1 polysaccharide lyase family 7 protein [Marinomonas sargassi]
MYRYKKLPFFALSTLFLVGCAADGRSGDKPIPADNFDLSHWKITLPMDRNNDGKIDEKSARQLRSYSHSDFFYLNNSGEMVFAAPNKAATTSGSSNTRSELRQMIRGDIRSIDTKSPRNNFALPTNPKGAVFGGKLNATLKVNHVAKRAGHPNKPPAYSVVVGQIHADKNLLQISNGKGFGWGNEPLKIYYKKWPHHEKGSVFWNYERNLPKNDPNRTDIAYPVWGNTWENPNEPGEQGIALGESFSYEVNVHGNMMYLTFSSPKKATVKYQINLANNVDAYGKVDEKDHPNGYAEDFMYFKAGAYNQCSTKDQEGIWYAACDGSGKWKVDKENGDYVSVSFSELTLSESSLPE